MKLRPVTEWELHLLKEASRYLRLARNAFRAAGAVKTKAACARALKSADGAQRHARRCKFVQSQ